MNYFSKLEDIDPSQHSFYKTHSVITNLAPLVHKILESMSEESEVCASKAFEFGVDDLLLTLLTNYLYHRTQYVVNNSIKSSGVNVVWGAIRFTFGSVALYDILDPYRNGTSSTTVCRP